MSGLLLNERAVTLLFTQHSAQWVGVQEKYYTYSTITPINLEVNATSGTAPVGLNPSYGVNACFVTNELKEKVALPEGLRLTYDSDPSNTYFTAYISGSPTKVGTYSLLITCALVDGLEVSSPLNLNIFPHQ